MKADFPELIELERTLEKASERATIKLLNNAGYKGQTFPIYGVIYGNPEPKAPSLGIFGGVHGLEKIGFRVALSYLKTVTGLLDWDENINLVLQKIRLVFIPMINPVGIYLNTRSNGNGVDLMRNAPINADKLSKLFIPGGHRISPKLPWFRGHNERMETESETVVQFVRDQLHTSDISISVDIHSGYGRIDRVWFPYAHTKEPFPNLTEMFALKKMLDETYPNHVYQIEPQSESYLTHGDLWDYLYEIQTLNQAEKLFLPLCLEMGSWNWIRKNPAQLFSLLGVFNPQLPHRSRRTLRRHIPFLDFLQKAVFSFPRWLTVSKERKEYWKQEALRTWYHKAA